MGDLQCQGHEETFFFLSLRYLEFDIKANQTAGKCINLSTRAYFSVKCRMDNGDSEGRKDFFWRKRLLQTPSSLRTSRSNAARRGCILSC